MFFNCLLPSSIISFKLLKAIEWFIVEALDSCTKSSTVDIRSVKLPEHFSQSLK